MQWLDIDKNIVWHPYSCLSSSDEPIFVKSTKGTNLYLEDGSVLIDGMSSWWSAIHGYNHPSITKAAKKQLENMPHIMFGGITHKNAIKLSSLLVDITGMDSVFLCDSGSVSVEVALKTALQYQQNKNKKTFVSFEYGYHGDTFGAMSLCDPTNSMHSIYGEFLTKNIFAPAPPLGFDSDISDSIDIFRKIIQKHYQTIAGVIIEPVVQGAGGMRIYNPKFLKEVRQICDEFDLVLIFDEIATGFGHTGKMFAYEWADVKPDILTIGKAMTAGYMTMASMLTTTKIAKGIKDSQAGVLMHGPTFMANPLSCAVAIKSIELLISSPWQKRVKDIEDIFTKELSNALKLTLVKTVRNIGAIGVIELKSDKYSKQIQNYCKNHGVWIRPFGKLIYAIVAYTIKKKDLVKIVQTMIGAIWHIENKGDI